MDSDLEHLRDWIGRSETSEERATLAPLRGLDALLDRDLGLSEGDPVGPMGHWCFFEPRVPMSGLGADGHPRRGDFLPPVPLPRRMFAGCRAVHHRPLRIGEMMRRVSRIADVAPKSGRSGTLVFCTVERSFYREDGSLALEEAQDLVYREAAKEGEGGAPAGTPAPSDHAWLEEIAPDPIMLFRYSAVTFNGHRIHYDRRYATEVEGYPGLVVHGPLIATLLLELARKHNPGRTLTSFAFRARAPLFDVAPFRVAARPAAEGRAVLWAVAPEGHVAMTAEAEFA